MKSIKLFAAALVLATPLASFAQSSDPVTRASVRAELVQLEKAGYNPASDQTQYPSNIEAVEARLNARDRAAADAYGPASEGKHDAGAPRARTSVAGLEPDLYSRP